MTLRFSRKLNLCIFIIKIITTGRELKFVSMPCFKKPFIMDHQPCSCICALRYVWSNMLGQNISGALHIFTTMLKHIEQDFFGIPCTSIRWFRKLDRIIIGNFMSWLILKKTSMVFLNKSLTSTQVIPKLLRSDSKPMSPMESHMLWLWQVGKDLCWNLILFQHRRQEAFSVKNCLKMPTVEAGLVLWYIVLVKISMLLWEPIHSEWKTYRDMRRLKFAPTSFVHYLVLPCKEKRIWPKF